MNSLGRILCAIDLEKASERAFDRALTLADADRIAVAVGAANAIALYGLPDVVAGTPLSR